MLNGDRESFQILPIRSHKLENGCELQSYSILYRILYQIFKKKSLAYIYQKGILVKKVIRIRMFN